MNENDVIEFPEETSKQQEEQIPQEESQEEQNQSIDMNAIKAFMKDMGYDSNDDIADYEDAKSKFSSYIGSQQAINSMADCDEDEQTLNLLKNQKLEDLSADDAVSICYHAYGLELSPEEASKQVGNAINKLIDDYESTVASKRDAARKAYEDDVNGITNAIKKMKLTETMQWSPEEEADIITRATSITKDGRSTMLESMLANKHNAIAAIAILDKLSKGFASPEDFIDAVRIASVKQVEDDFNDQIISLSFT